MDTLRIGCLGAARIAPAALTKPAAGNPGVSCAAVAARDVTRARAFADKHKIPVVHDSYDALLADESLDAIYNPLPNGLHGLWTLKALEAGKHVLCEKPFTANAAEAARVADAAEKSGLVVMEAFHWRYHPLAARVLDIIASGELGHPPRGGGAVLPVADVQGHPVPARPRGRCAHGRGVLPSAHRGPSPARSRPSRPRPPS
jgi:predicted dehydrogenase